MIAKRSNRTSRPPEAPAGIIQRFASGRLRESLAGNGSPSRPIGIPRELAAQMLTPSSWEVLTSQLPAMAAALAYRTIFGLIPMLVIGLMVIGAYAEEKEISRTVTRLMQFAGLDQVAIDSGADSTDGPAAGEDDNSLVNPSAGGTPPAAESAADSGSAAGKQAAARKASSQRLDEWIGKLVKQVRSIPFRTIGFVGLGALIYAAISMLVEIERAFNQIYRVPAGRAWWSRVTRYWTLLTLGSIGLFATFYATDAFISRIDQVQSWSIGSLLHGGAAESPAAGAGSVGAPGAPAGDAKAGTGEGSGSAAAAGSADGAVNVFSLRTVLGYTATVMITTLFMTVIYSVVPNARVKLTAAIGGAFVAAILWETAKWAFAFYVKSAGYTRLYGALALMPLFLLWIYLGWIIVLLGLFLSYLIQTRGSRPVVVLSDGGKSIVDPASIVLVAGAVGRQFRSGKSSDAGEIAKATGIDRGVVVVMLEALVERGILHRVATGDDEERFALARPPESIGVAECLAISHELCDQPEGRPGGAGAEGPLAGLMRPLERAREEAAKNRTLADLLSIQAEAPDAGTPESVRSEVPAVQAAALNAPPLPGASTATGVGPG